MLEQIYYLIALAVYSIFIIRLVISWIVGDFDFDSDVDVDDIVSFKGLTHFLMGASGWLSVKSYFTHDVQWYDYLIAFLLGILFVWILYKVYKLMLKLESKPVALSGKDLVGRSGRIYLRIGQGNDKYTYQVTVDNGVGTVEVPAISEKKFNIGNMVILSDYDGAYFKLV